ncbi:amphi-Trp domain-containing protein [Roseibium polysiphoniae]|uniref:Amphi-Trp domain-containing protein n=2 Tax=Roseibium TaxID=150830 RepID=A0ABR9CB26_9HYPH|nr:amphi-Trp domain-containing protein [Roseibium polysiphoniae]MBD8877090.1 amphi-Trp domain-containing protein [Roseibium polysiphoniae]
MMERKDRFKHESIQDRKTIQSLITAINRGIAKGELHFSDDTGEITLNPDGMLNLKVTASKDEARCRMDIRISWANENTDLKDAGKLKVKS